MTISTQAMPSSTSAPSSHSDPVAATIYPIWVGSARSEWLAQVRAALQPASQDEPEFVVARGWSEVPANAVFLLDPQWQAPDEHGAQVPAVVVGLAGEQGSLLRAGAHANCQYLVELPEGGHWLAELVVGGIAPEPVFELAGPPDLPGPPVGAHFSAEPVDDQPPTEARGLVVGVLGCVGGVGSSTLALAIAHSAAASESVLLVQADPWDVGIDASLARDPEREAGWAAIAPGATLLDPGAMRATLAQEAGMWLLTGPGSDQGEVPAALPAVIAAARVGFDLAVLDFGRSAAALAELVTCDFAILVLPASTPGLSSAKLLLERLEKLSGGRGLGPHVRVVVREGGPLATEVIEACLGVSVSCLYRSSKLLDERIATGEVLVGRAGRRLDKLGRAVRESL